MNIFLYRWLSLVLLVAVIVGFEFAEGDAAASDMNIHRVYDVPSDDEDDVDDDEVEVLYGRDSAKTRSAQPEAPSLEEMVVPTEMELPAEFVPPDPADANFTRAYQCASCATVATETFESFLAAARRLRGRPGISDLLSSLDQVCRSVSEQYGLVFRGARINDEAVVVVRSDPLVSVAFSKDPEDQRIHGGWIPAFLQRQCRDVHTAHLRREVLDHVLHPTATFSRTDMWEALCGATCHPQQ